MNSQAIQLRDAFADLERVRMGGYLVDLVPSGGKMVEGKWKVYTKIIVRKNPDASQEKGIWRKYVDHTTPGHWDPIFVKMVLEREAKLKDRPYKPRPIEIRINDRMAMEAERFCKEMLIEKGHETRNDYADGSEMIGALGEQAARFHFGLTMRMEAFKGGDEGYDIEFMGQRIDIKTTQNMPSRYMIAQDEWEPGKSDILLAVEASGRLAKIIGWMWEKDFEKARRPGSEFGMPTPGCHVVTVDKLQPMNKLLEAVRHTGEALVPKKRTRKPKDTSQGELV